ncbi:ComEC/Rec2 family competence protein [Bifidobacterium sp. SMB2]|uniref:ComEC/Rec2 family competence protein n=1 Tax=Bifidobacterium saimiriisciurei TaxID=2661627 RepID=A0ABX0C6S8_9BIFI|nr:MULTISPECIES: ComEC/Rec2 family competence protein [Bifidobacterium]NEG96048.1 ComEC/Rec2 family competence protein [Bifidobacterium sp. SMB2]NEH10874.1 ComEC/Rec2 family competence protein [Bifidobacterium saimiriisciurei]
MRRHHSYRLRERGGRDARLLPAAATVWTILLAEHMLFGTKGMTWLAAGVTVMAIVLGIVAIIGATPSRPMPTAIGQVLWHGAVIIAAACCALASGGFHDLAAVGDPMVSAADAETEVVVLLDVTGPVMASSLRDMDCQTDAQVHGILSDGVRSASSARIRVYASGDACGWHQGGGYAVEGAARHARFGDRPLWLVVDDDRGAVVRIREPAWWDAAVERLRGAFLEQTDRLPGQGRILVPGLTLGVLGQDVYRPHVGEDGRAADAVDETAARLMEDDFKNSGIMHLMAVSGGHFVLVASLVRRSGSMLLMPRQVKAAGVAGVYVVLTALVYPSDSVLRAAVMGGFGVACMLLGRPGQALAALNWTVIASLLLEPELAHSYGFALSCAAVYGIVILDRPISQALAAVMPGALAQAASITIAAQIPTLPIQVMMNPGIPLLSVPANLLVAPVVSLTTLLGLSAVGVSWFAPPLGHGLVAVASAGTLLLQRCATLLGRTRFSVLPWHDGVVGAAVMAAFEILVALAVTLIRRSVRRWRGRGGLAAGGGRPYVPTPMERLGVWWRDTRAMIFGPRRR